MPGLRVDTNDRALRDAVGRQLGFFDLQGDGRRECGRASCSFGAKKTVSFALIFDKFLECLREVGGANTVP